MNRPAITPSSAPSGRLNAVQFIRVDSEPDGSSTSPRPGPDSLRLVDGADLSPGPGEVVVATAAAGVNRADLLQRQGLYPPPAGTSPVMGLEASGRVLAVGSAVTRFQPGDPVVALLAGGGYATQFVAPEGQLLPVPDGIDLITAATIVEVAATVVSNFDAVGLAAGQTVLVQGGAGGIGTFAVQYAHWLGCRVITTAGSREKLDLCREFGADLAVDYHHDWAAEVAAATESRGVDVVLDVMGASYLATHIELLAPDGRIVIIGMQGGAKTELNLSKLLAKRGTITATGLRFRPADQKAAICRRVEEHIWPALTRGDLRPAPITRFALADAHLAHRHLESGTAVGKLVLTVD